MKFLSIMNNVYFFIYNNHVNNFPFIIHLISNNILTLHLCLIDLLTVT